MPFFLCLAICCPKESAHKIIQEFHFSLGFRVNFSKISDSFHFWRRLEIAFLLLVKAL
jgi:hypothetical protein